MGPLNPHDLLRLVPGARIDAQTPVPDWAILALLRCPFVVVRRGVSPGVPAGIRGRSRAQRFACTVSAADIAQVIRPQDIALPPSGPFARELRRADRILRGRGMIWGPVGSVGFSLAAGRPSAGADSDLDLLVILRQPLSAAQAGELLQELRDVSPRVDTPVQVQGGTLALAELAAGQPPYLLKSRDGEKLVRNPFTAKGE